MAKLVRIVISLILLGFLFVAVARDWHTISNFWLSFNFPLLIISFLLMLLIYPEGAFCWYIILRRMGLKVDLKDSIRVWIFSNTARYIPGLVWQYIGRSELARRELGIPRIKTFSSILFEIFLVLVAGVFIATSSLPFLNLQFFNTQFLIFLLPVLFIFLHPRIFQIIIRVLAKVTKNELTAESLNIKFSDTTSILPWFIFNFIINGTALTFLVASFSQDVDLFDFIGFSGFYAFSWVVGFISIFAPGGLGVVEVSLAYLLSFRMPFALASTIALSYRFFLTVAELLVFLIFLRLRRSKDGK